MERAVGRGEDIEGCREGPGGWRGPRGEGRTLRAGGRAPEDGEGRGKRGGH